jgi:hypothetical protein
MSTTSFIFDSGAVFSSDLFDFEDLKAAAFADIDADTAVPSDTATGAEDDD